MKTLVIVTHPKLADSRINRAWSEALEAAGDMTIHYLYDAYPDGKINVQTEQELLLAHDRIILQFPFYWYSSPALLKQWQDDVLAYGFAYGSSGDKLRGKELGLAVSTGGPREAYRPDGYNKYTLEQLLLPFQATSNLIGTKLLPLYAISGAFQLTDEQIAESAEQYVKHVKEAVPSE